MISAEVIADSLSPAGARLTTMQLVYPRFIHAEFMTHRQFSRNASSSRAIPVAKMIAQVQDNPATPIHWGKNQAGMQAREELPYPQIANVEDLWFQAAQSAADYAGRMAAEGAHKQIVNRILEPFQHIHVVVTATEWDNFFALRCHVDAQPEIQALACAMRDVLKDSVPSRQEYHLPYISPHDIAAYLNKTEAASILGREVFYSSAKLKRAMYDHLAPVSASRCARVSYLNHDGSNPSEKDDRWLFNRLVGQQPIHASPTEHQAWAAELATDRNKNFSGWIQFRTDVERTYEHCR